MAATIGKVSAVFTASTSGLTAGVNRAQNSMRQMQASVSGLQRSLSVLTTIQVGQVFASIASSAIQFGRSLLHVAGAQSEAIDQASKLSRTLGMTYGELAGIAHAADLSGVSLEQVAKASTRADVVFQNAANGSAAASRAFDRLGISVEDLQGMTAAERFNAIADAIASIPDPAARAAAAVQLFGRQGASLLPMFEGGAEAIRAARAEAERFGRTLTDAQAQDVEDMNDAFTRARRAIEGVIQQVVAYLAPAVDQITTMFSDMVGTIGGANIGQAIGEGIMQGAVFLAGIADYVAANLSATFGALAESGASMGEAFNIGYRVAEVFRAVFNMLEMIGNSLGGALTAVIKNLLQAAARVAKGLGFSGRAKSLESWAQAAAATEQSFGDALRRNMQEGGQALENAFAESTAQAAAARGPFSQSVEEAIARARASAASISVPPAVQQQQQQQPAAIPGFSTEQLRAIDSRSSEGIAEMLRLRRGEQDDIQQQQLTALNRIADNTEDSGVDIMEAALPAF